MSATLLIADIGGTNARFALADPHAATPLLDDSVREFAVADFPSLADAARHYLDQAGAHADRGVFAVAGRVDGDEARITNHPWVISRSRTREMLGFDQVHLLKAGLRVQAPALQFEFQELINRRLRRGFRCVRGEGGAQRGQSN